MGRTAGLSEDLWVADPETEHRRRAIWGLVILGLAAVIVVALMVFFLGSSGGSDNNGLPFTSQIPELSTTAGSGQHSSSHSSSSSSSSRASTSASRAATTKCSSGTSCTLEGDAGGVIAAINKLRTSNGQRAVPRTTTDHAE